jgi:hypothetical protein
MNMSLVDGVPDDLSSGRIGDLENLDPVDVTRAVTLPSRAMVTFVLTRVRHWTLPDTIGYQGSA